MTIALGAEFQSIGLTRKLENIMIETKHAQIFIGNDNTQPSALEKETRIPKIKLGIHRLVLLTDKTSTEKPV
jgi:hypothetical protein